MGDQDHVVLLAEHERRAWNKLIELMARLPATLDQQLLSAGRTTFHVYTILAILRDRPGHRMRLSDLAEQSHSSLSRLSHSMRRMELDDLVRREPDPLDRRASYAVLTDRGRTHVEHLTPDHLAFLRTLVLDRFDAAELEALERAATLICGAITDEAERTEPPRRRYARPADRR